MNLRNRLKKLERAGDDSTVCACYPQISVEMYRADLSEDSDTSEPVLTGEPVPDVCADCRKPIEKQKSSCSFATGRQKTAFPNSGKQITNKKP